MNDYVHESCCRQVAELRTEIERRTAENRRYEKYIDIQANEILEHEQTIATLTAELEHHKGKAEVWEDAARAAQARVEALEGALDKLARLGNEPHYGNSDGNVIAQKALAATEQEKP